jgi:hypothetical protein
MSTPAMVFIKMPLPGNSARGIDIKALGGCLKITRACPLNALRS